MPLLPDKRPGHLQPRGEWTEVDYLRSIRAMLQFFVVLACLGIVLGAVAVASTF